MENSQNNHCNNKLPSNMANATQQNQKVLKQMQSLTLTLSTLQTQVNDQRHF